MIGIGSASDSRRSGQGADQCIDRVHGGGIHRMLRLRSGDDILGDARCLSGLLDGEVASRRAAYSRWPSVAPGAVAARIVSSSIWCRTALSALINAGVT